MIIKETKKLFRKQQKSTWSDLLIKGTIVRKISDKQFLNKLKLQQNNKGKPKNKNYLQISLRKKWFKERLLVYVPLAYNI